MVSKEAHSSQWLLNETRDYLWNRDHLQLIAERLGLESARTMLDVGCGIGHWSFLLGSVLSASLEVTGVDREQRWVEAASERAASGGVDDRFSFAQGDVTALDFDDGSFDIVTCQTLLMHLRDPRAAVDELLRVTKPGGMVVCSEPNNLSALVMLSSTNMDDPIDDALELVRFGLLCERGKRVVGDGRDSIGNLLPGYFAEAGVVDIESFSSDKTHMLYPPYASEEQQKMRTYFLDGAERRVGWPRETTKRYFLAGGGSEAEFEESWKRREWECDRDAEAIHANRYHICGGFVLYLIAARHPG